MQHIDTAHQFAAALTAKFGPKYPERRFEIMAGPKYARLVSVRAVHGREDRHAFAFVDLATGALLKSDGWKGPAKGARFDLSTEEGFAQAVEAADLFGGFLYR